MMRDGTSVIRVIILGTGWLPYGIIGHGPYSLLEYSPEMY